MELTILGYWGGYPSAGGATAGYLITTDEGRILLDCGSGVMSRLAAHTTVEQLDGVILSHLHYDHMADIGVLQYAAAGAIRNKRMSRKLSIFAPDEPAAMRHMLDDPHTEMTAIEPGFRTRLAGADIQFAPVEHTVPCYAVKITCQGRTIVYSGDTAYCETLVELARDADLLLCEATILEGSGHTTGQGHMNAVEAATVAHKANAKKLLLVHLPCDARPDEMKRLACSVFHGPVLLPDTETTYRI
ncbi:MBL fold metallo-hydrolase [Paenibacillus thalictri]|uniref:MBL fold metallo-hydrolase n=1 Tax=Paenibacillus thalictri TaxID=2527873 RepID=A0A4Q9DS98_9BACL|nr:MBL fold metallo-hydrolase [Paenibacillus thalictri]TBL79747.1 MBL fold metallo-hydrolase [Paenibacillus thalictri]